MKPIPHRMRCLAASSALLFQAGMACAADEASAAGQKLDSGLGDLPHYRYWADPTGKAPVRTEQRVAESTLRR